MADYQPRPKKQLTGSKLGPKNCNMSAAAVYADAQSLGVVQKTADQMRTLSGDTVGGTDIGDAATALHGVGMTLDIDEAVGFADFKAKLMRTRGAIAHGDYGKVPIVLRGDREFTDQHSIYVQPWDTLHCRVWDGLDDGRIDQPSGHKAPQAPILWPWGVLQNYMSAFPNATVSGHLTITRVKASVAVVNVRSATVRKSTNIVGTIKKGATLRCGRAVVGERIGGNAVWYTVWYKNHVRYIHSSVIKRV